MPCLLALLALIAPRLVIVFIWLLTDWFSRAFATWLMPILGFLFLPYTTLAYMAAMLNNQHAISSGYLVLIIIAAIVDIGHWGGGFGVRKRRR